MSNFLEELRSINIIRADEWYKGSTMTTSDPVTELLFRSNELGGECGEAQNIAKKLARNIMMMEGGLAENPGRQMLADELADVIICVDRVAEMYNIDLTESVKNKFNKTSDKMGLETKF